ncbi:MAG: transglutaminaseTgpA domain-containing protein [Chloroflexi bacterium]|nr:transglutaminaseTgpA domain-containing protein [Chloroflexota bacterium]
MKRTDLFTLLVLFVMLGAAVNSIAAAEWMPGLDVAIWAVAFGLITGTALSFSNFTGWMAHITSFIYGLFVIGFIGGTHESIPQSLEWRDRVFLIADKIVEWVREAVSNGTSRESLIFVLILCALFWLLGYTAAWYSFRYRRIWHIILPTGVTLFSNIYYYAGNKPMELFLVIYLVCALILLVESNLADREESWLRERVRFTRGLRTSFTLAGVGIAAVALFFAWRVPEIAASETARGVFNKLNTPYSELLARWNRLFSTLQNYNLQPMDSYGQSLTLGGPRNLTPDPVMDVTVPPNRYYWRATSYDNYDGATWSNTILDARDLRPQDNTLAFPDYLDRITVSANFAMYRGTDSIYVPSIPQSASVPSQAIYRNMDDGTVELLQLKVPAPLLPGNRYTAIGSLSLADANALRETSGNYPSWIGDKYVQLPPTLPERVKELARNIASNAGSDYDKAAAIEGWLRANITYDEQLAAPPPGVEASDYILFRTRRAYCNYYATAMVVMLRSLGIPSRIATGYAQGELVSTSPDFTTAVYNVKVSDSHTWVEAFFPQYGWVEFEPTAGQPPIQRPDSGAAAATVTPNAPTPTPLPTVEPTPDPAQQPQVVPPDQPEGSNPGAFLQGVLNVLLSLARFLPFVLILGVLASAGVFSLRFAEEAGFRNLPPVQRAYAMLSRWATWMGIGNEHTPYEQARVLSQRAPNTEAQARTITHLYVANRFGAAAPNPNEEAQAKTAWEKARRELHKTWLKSKLKRLLRWRN